MSTTTALLRKEFINGLDWRDWSWLAVGLAMQTAATAYGHMTGNPDTALATVCAYLGVFTVVMCAQGKISYNIFNFAQMITYVVGVSIPQKLYGESIEYAFYFLTALWGVYVWAVRYGQTKDTKSIEVKAKKLSLTGWLTLAAYLIAGTAVMTYFLKKTDDPAPFMDAISTIPAFAAQILMCGAWREQWLCWLIIDIASVIMFVMLGSWMMVAMFAFWTLNCIYGWVKWTRSGSKDYERISQ